MDVGQLMSKDPATCRTTDSLAKAAQLMWDCDCGSVPVVDENGQLAGMITDRDICMAAFTQHRAPDDLGVADAMSKQVYSCRMDDALSTAEELMSVKQIRRVPVVDDDNRPIGMLSLNDLIRYAEASVEHREGLEHEVAETLASISQPQPRAVQPPAQ